MEVLIWAQGTVESSRSKRSQRGHHVRMRDVCGAGVVRGQRDCHVRMKDVWEGVGVVRGHDRADLGSPPPHPTQLSWITSLTHFFVAQRVQRRVGHAGKL